MRKILKTFLILGVIFFILYYLIGVRKSKCLINLVNKYFFNNSKSIYDISSKFGNILLLLSVSCFFLIFLKYLMYLIGKLLSLAILAVFVFIVVKIIIKILNKVV